MGNSGQKGNRMSYEKIDTFETKIKTGKRFSVKTQLKDKNMPPGGVSINFLKINAEENLEERWPNNLLFHFNPRPNDTIILNTYQHGEWQKECVIRGTNEEINKGDLTLTIQVLDATGKEFNVSLNDQFLTAFKSEADIRETNCIVFSPEIRIIRIYDPDTESLIIFLDD